jgi:hypothetical protein
MMVDLPPLLVGGWVALTLTLLHKVVQSVRARNRYRAIAEDCADRTANTIAVVDDTEADDD